MCKAYWQVPVAKLPSAISTPFGVFVFKAMPFGLKNAGSTFQRLIDNVLAGLPFCWSYKDDLICFSRLVEEHKEAVCDVLKRLRMAGLIYNPTKSKFFHSTIDFLGHNVLESGFTPIAQNTTKLLSFATPTEKTTLKRFFGLLNYYHQFLLAWHPW